MTCRFSLIIPLADDVLLLGHSGGGTVQRVLQESIVCLILLPIASYEASIVSLTAALKIIK